MDYSGLYASALRKLISIAQRQLDAIGSRFTHASAKPREHASAKPLGDASAKPLEHASAKPLEGASTLHEHGFVLDYGKLKGRNFAHFVRELSEHGIIAFRDKFKTAYLIGLDLRAKTVVDVGVNRGTRQLWNAFRDRKLVLVDPAPGCVERCKATDGHRFDMDGYELALGSESSTATLHCEEFAGMNSLMVRADASEHGATGTVQVDVRRLDELLREGGYEPPFGIKIDTEGYELEILQGCTGILADTEFIIAEVSVKHIFQGGYRFSDIVSFLARQDFELFDVLNARGWPPNSLDVLFLRRSDDKFLFRRPSSSARAEGDAAE